jgi:hypothetical protein
VRPVTPYPLDFVRLEIPSGPVASGAVPRFLPLDGNEMRRASASVCDPVSSTALGAVLRLTRSPKTLRCRWSFFVFPRPRSGLSNSGHGDLNDVLAKDRVPEPDEAGQFLLAASRQALERLEALCPDAPETALC